MTKYWPVVLTTFFIVLKLITREKPVRLSDDFAQLTVTIERLKILKPERQRGPRVPNRDENPRRLRDFVLWVSRSKVGGSSASGPDVEPHDM